MAIESVSTQADLKRARRVRQPQKEQPQDRLPPHAPDSERAALGCVMLSPNEVMPELIVSFGAAGKDVYYDLRHQTIYEHMVQIWEKKKPIDVISLMELLKDKNLLEQVGGLPYLSTLPDQVPSAANISYYTSQIMEKYVMRKAVNTCTELIGRIYEHAGDVDSLMDGFERDALKIREGCKVDVIPPMRDSVAKAINTIEDYANKHGAPIGIPTGFLDFDKMTCGLINGEVTIIAARPSMGKTSLAMNIVEHVAIDQREPVGVFSLEMNRDTLILRMLCSRARVNLRNIQEGFIADRDYPKITGAAGKLAGSGIHIDDIRGVSIMQLRAKARRMKQQYGCKLFVIDYLGLLHATIGGKRIDNRQREMAEISHGVHDMAGELNVPVIALAQLNRALEKENRKPVMSDLRESGEIEQDADTIGFLYRPKLKEEDEEVADYKDAVPMNLLIAKQRNGPTGEVALTFLKSFTRFENAAKVTYDDITRDQQATLV